MIEVQYFKIYCDFNILLIFMKLGIYFMVKIWSNFRFWKTIDCQIQFNQILEVAKYYMNKIWLKFRFCKIFDDRKTADKIWSNILVSQIFGGQNWSNFRGWQIFDLQNLIGIQGLKNISWSLFDQKMKFVTNQ